MGRGRRTAAHIPILLYHAVDDTVSPSSPFEPYTVRRRQFAAHLDHLVAEGYQSLTISGLVDEMRRGHSLPDRTVVITFDDGFADFAEAAWPELHARQLAATFYVATGEVGGTSRWLAPLGEADRPMCSWDQLRHLTEQGCEIGAHSVTHPSLDCLSPADAQREITASKQHLEAGLQRPVRSFAYPHGHYDARTRDAVRRSGFESACAVRNALSHLDDDVFAMARFTVMSGVDVDQLDSVLTAKSLRLASRRQHLRTRAYRKVRRAAWRVKSSTR